MFCHILTQHSFCAFWTNYFFCGITFLAICVCITYSIGNVTLNLVSLSALLALYLNKKLGYDEDDATTLYHGYTMTFSFMSIVGGIMGDCLGKFKTILYLSIVYALGASIVFLSAIPNIGISPKVTMFIGLFLVGVGGGMTPCLYAYGGDQFKLPEQAQQLTTFFSLLYFFINCGVLASTVLLPILRSDVHCFGQSDCYSLAFGVPAALMIASTGELLSV